MLNQPTIEKLQTMKLHGMVDTFREQIEIPHRDDRTDDGAFGAMMLLASGKSPRNDDF
jgi:hypothetical protein